MAIVGAAILAILWMDRSDSPRAGRRVVAVGNCRIECVGSKLVFTEQQQTTVAGFEDFVEESVRQRKAITRQ